MKKATLKLLQYKRNTMMCMSTKDDTNLNSVKFHLVESKYEHDLYNMSMI